MLFIFNKKSLLVPVIIIESNARILFTLQGSLHTAYSFYSAKTIRTLLEIQNFNAIDKYTITILVRATIHLYIIICTFWKRQIHIFSGFEFIVLPLRDSTLRTRNIIA